MHTIVPSTRPQRCAPRPQHDDAEQEQVSPEQALPGAVEAMLRERGRGSLCHCCVAWMLLLCLSTCIARRSCHLPIYRAEAEDRDVPRLEG